jgi:two-component system chemotaxis response regulator CheB
VIRVLLAEDSAVVREYLIALLQEDPDLRLVGIARDGQEAVEQAIRLRPDLILMDVHMPRLNGLEATREIMARVPIPIVLISSSLSREEATLGFEAIKAGALTVIDKPPGLDHPLQPERAESLLRTVKVMAEVKVVRRWARHAPARRWAESLSSVSTPAPGRRVRLVAIGASTGGPAVLAEILGALPADLLAPVLVVQHIAPGFAAGLAEWLAQGARLAVRLAASLDPLVPGTVHIAPEGTQVAVTSDGRIRLLPDGGEDGFRPSVSHLFHSIARAYGADALGVLLTGMGRDGADGLLQMRRAGAVTIAQDEETSVVFGMPRKAIRLEAAQYVLAPRQIAEAIAAIAGARSQP